jgi:hypothetical protein
MTSNPQILLLLFFQTGLKKKKAYTKMCNRPVELSKEVDFIKVGSTLHHNNTAPYT